MKCLILPAGFAFLVACLTSTASAQFQQFQPASTVQLPVFGVTVDARGVMQVRQFAPPGGEDFRRRFLRAAGELPRDLAAQSGLRKISLRRLESAVAKLQASGKPLTGVMRHLAGMTRIEYLIAVPESNDVIIAGPAEGWLEDASGRAVGIHTANPTLLLDDWLVAMRSFNGQVENRWVGCSIGSTAEGLARLKQFQKTIPDYVPDNAEAKEFVARETWKGIEKSLGLANVVVFGVDSNTHIGQVMVEADYRMKLIGIGREQPPIEMATFFDQLRGNPSTISQRWWFEPNYSRIVCSNDALSLHFNNAPLVLGTEDYSFDQQGVLRPSGRKSSRAAVAYAKSFTKNFDQIAEMSPVFDQLRDVTDLLVAAAYLSQFEIWNKVGWRPDLFLNAEKLPVRPLPVPRQAPNLANVAWRGRSMIAPAGGVAILASESLTREHLLQDEKLTTSARETILRDLPADPWWWD